MLIGSTLTDGPSFRPWSVSPGHTPGSCPGTSLLGITICREGLPCPSNVDEGKSERGSSSSDTFLLFCPFKPSPPWITIIWSRSTEAWLQRGAGRAPDTFNRLHARLIRSNFIVELTLWRTPKMLMSAETTGYKRYLPSPLLTHQTCTGLHRQLRRYGPKHEMGIRQAYGVVPRSGCTSRPAGMWPLTSIFFQRSTWLTSGPWCSTMVLSPSWYLANKSNSSMTTKVLRGSQLMTRGRQTTDWLTVTKTNHRNKTVSCFAVRGDKE